MRGEPCGFLGRRVLSVSSGECKGLGVAEGGRGVNITGIQNSPVISFWGRLPRDEASAFPHFPSKTHNF